MRFVNTVESKNRLNAVLTEVGRGETIVVTRRGKPATALLPTDEAELEQILFERGTTSVRRSSKGWRTLAQAGWLRRAGTPRGGSEGRAADASRLLEDMGRIAAFPKSAQRRVFRGMK